MIINKFLSKESLLKIEGRSEVETFTGAAKDVTELLGYIYWLHDKILGNPLRPFVLEAKACPKCEGVGIINNAFCNNCSGKCFL